MDNEQVARLTRRVYQLEQQVETLRRHLDAPPIETERLRTSPSRPAAAPTVMPAPMRTPRPPSPPQDEVDFFGSWFARAGAVVLLMGVGFAFKYAVDRGIIGPAARVTIGIVLGLCLAAAGEWAVRRRWLAWAQAVSAAGVAVLYVSVLAAVQLYDLIDPAAAFTLLVSITALGGFLALRHDSFVLALLAATGGYLNALILATEQPRPIAVFVYLSTIDALVLGLAAFRKWRALDVVALVGTVLAFGSTAADASFEASITFATLLVLVFVALPFVRLTIQRIASEQVDILVIGGAILAYFAYALFLFSDHGYGQTQGAFTLSLGATLAALALTTRGLDERLSTSTLVMALAFAALFVPIQFSGTAVPAGWATQGVFLVGVASRTRDTRVRIAGVVVVALSVLALVSLGEEQRPTRLLLSPQAAAFVVTIASLALTAWLLSRDTRPFPPSAPIVAALAGLALAVTWVSLEATAELERGAATEPAVQFAVSAVWGTFAVALLAIGVRLRARWVRLAAAGLFALVLVKVGVADVWTLSGSYRVVAFLGLGVVLLGCSLAYYRFRDYLSAEVPAASTTA